MIDDRIQSFIALLNHPLNKHAKLKATGRILWWKINQLFFHLPAIVTLQGNNMKCLCPSESAYGSMVVYCNLPEYSEMTFLEKILKSDSIFFDIGANIGVYSLIAASKIKKGKIFSFEPIPSVLDILYKNIRINNLDNKVKVIEKVVSDKTGNERFVIQDISEYSHISLNQTSKTTLIPSVRLDDFAKLEKIEFIDVIKIDVEGAELKVLKGLENYLKLGKVGILIIEFNSGQVIDYLKRLNYRIYILDKKINLKEIQSVNEIKTLNIIAILNK